MSSVTLLETKLENTSLVTQRKFDNNLQILRGIASIAVVWHHIGSEGYLDPNYKLNLGFVPYGNMRPLLFFMLSGYLVSFSNKRQLTTWADVKEFGKKKFYRLYPIYLLAVFFSFWIAREEFSHIQLWSHFLFLQVMVYPVLEENVPLWSMNFEILFYLFFILLSFAKINPLKFSISAVLLGAFLLFLEIEVPLLISYCIGLTFWGIGLYGGRIKFRNENFPTSYLISLLLLIFCYQQLEVAEYFLNKFEIDFLPNKVDHANHPLRFSNLICVPICAMIILGFSNKVIMWRKSLTAFVYFPIIIRICYLVYTGNLKESLYVPVVLFIISLFCLIFSFNLKLKVIRDFFNFLGRISYSVYLVHFPVMILFIRFTPLSGNVYTAVLRLFIYLSIIVLLSHVLERKYQSLMISLLERRTTFNGLEGLLKRIKHRAI